MSATDERCDEHQEDCGVTHYCGIAKGHGGDHECCHGLCDFRWAGRVEVSQTHQAEKERK